jgi:hypothetical protein
MDLRDKFEKFAVRRISDGTFRYWKTEMDDYDGSAIYPNPEEVWEWIETVYKSAVIEEVKKSLKTETSKPKPKVKHAKHIFCHTCGRIDCSGAYSDRCNADGITSSSS